MVQVNNSGHRLFGISLVIARITWGGITLLILTMLILSVTVEYQKRLTEAIDVYSLSLKSLNLSAVFYAKFRTFMDLSLAFTFFVIAVLVFFRKPSSRIVIFTSIATQTFGVLFVPTLYFLELALPEWDLAVSFIRAVGLASSLIVYMYMIPDGQFRPAWTRRTSLLWIGLVAIWFFFPGTPANLVHLTTWTSTIALGYILYIIAFGSGIAAQLYRYRFISDVFQRQQTKWFVFGTTLGFIGFFLYYLPTVVLPGLFVEGGIYRLLQIFFGVPIFHLFILAIPICIAISVTRFRLWDIDHLINRTLIAGALTVLLIMVYAVSVVSLTQVFIWISGKDQDNIVTAASTLVMTTLFFPLRRGVQDLIDQKFYRKRYNTEQTLTALSYSLREEVDLENLLKGLITLVNNALRPSQVSIWLVQKAEKKADMQNGPDPSSLIQAWIQPFDPIISFFQLNPNILEIDTTNLTSPALSLLKKSKVSITVPLIGQGQFVGLINLGNRLSGQDYSRDDYHLLTILASQAAPALRVAQLVRQLQIETVEREREEYEMNVARMIQQNFLPKQPPDMPNWQVAAYYRPARAVGGDFYDFNCLPDGRVAFVIGDVSGHGVPAALMMVNIRSTLRDASRQYSSPGAILKHANYSICQDMPTSMFATCLYAILDPLCGKITFANAGHNLPMLWTKDRIEELWVSGFPLGIMENAEYEEISTTISAEECILLFSDGLVEARDANREMFGEERIKEIVAAQPVNAREVIDDLLRAMSIYIGTDSEQEDDVTIVSLHCLATDPVPGFQPSYDI